MTEEFDTAKTEDDYRQAIVDINDLFARNNFNLNEGISICLSTIGTALKALGLEQAEVYKLYDEVNAVLRKYTIKGDGGNGK